MSEANMITDVNKPRYIGEIDTLRALAVLLVVLFHAYPTVVPGGYIGVDVFFVISGFVIARAYLPDLLARRTSLGSFWASRFRRLSPALLLMLAVVTVLALIFIQPDKLFLYGKSLLAQPFYIQNFIFWNEGDYFESAQTKPLLHTWSLAVEEQFYLLFGIAVLIFRFAPRLFLPSLIILTSVSLLVSFYIEPRSPKTVFFLLPTRIWQISLGIFAFYAAKSIGRRGAGLNHVLVGASFATIAVCGFFIFDKTSPFPGPHALITCGATAMALIALDTQAKSFEPFLFSPLRYVGRISYGFYLWHWPPISLWFLTMREEPTAPVATLLMLLAFGVAALSYHYLEQPIRQRRFMATIPSLSRFVISGMVASTAVSAAIIMTGGALPLYPKEVRPFFFTANDRGSNRCPKSFRLLNPEAEFCPLTNNLKGPGVLILGDSHADVIDEMLAEIAQTVELPIYLTVRNCEFGQYGETQYCSDNVLREIIEQGKKSEISSVLAISYWSDTMDLIKLIEQTQLMMDADLDLMIMEVVPNDDSFDPIGRARTALETGSPPSLEGLPLNAYLEATRTQRANFAAVVERFPGRVSVITPSDYLCKNEVCRFHTDGKPNYRDTHHLSRTGGELLRPLFQSLFENIRAR